MEVIGHVKIIGFFDKVIAHDRVSHAYCFVGPTHVGKRTVVEWLAARVLCTPADKLHTHPDMTVVEQIFNEKKERMNQDITIEQIRALRGMLYKHSFFGGWKVAVIDQADKMNANGMNALLKTIEEPRSKTVMFLTTDDESALPETVRSRCQMIYFQPVEETALQTALAARGVSADQAQELSRISHGLPGLALRWIEDPDLYRAHTHEVKRFVGLVSKRFHEQRQAIEDLFGDKKDHILAREQLHEVLGLWLLLLRDWALGAGRTRVYPATAELPDIDSAHMIKIIERVQMARTLLLQNIHPRLLIEHILLSFARV